MNLRLSTKTTRIRLTREELGSLHSNGSIEEVLKFSGEIKVRIHVAIVPGTCGRCFTTHVGGDLTMNIELIESDVVQLSNGEVAAADGVTVVEVDAFTSERRKGKEKPYESVLKTDHSR